MSRKCGISLVTYLLFTLVALIAMHAFLYLPVNQWVGVGVGGGMLVVSLIVCFIFREKKKKTKRGKKVSRIVRPAAYIFNALASGFAMSSLFVYLGQSPTLWQSAAVWGALALYFALYCLCTNIPFFQKFSFPCMLVWCLLAYAGVIVGICLVSECVFSLAALLCIPFTAFFVSLSADVADAIEHLKNILYASFGALFVVIIAVLLVLSEGEIADGLDAPSGGTLWRKNYNPYLFRQ